MVMMDKGYPPETNGDNLDFRGNPFEFISQKDAQDLRLRLTARLECLGWLLGYRQDWDEPLIGYFNEKVPGWVSDFQD